MRFDVRFQLLGGMIKTYINVCTGIVYRIYVFKTKPINSKNKDLITFQFMKINLEVVSQQNVLACDIEYNFFCL